MRLIQYLAANAPLILDSTVRHLELFAESMAVSLVLGIALAVAVSSRPGGKAAKAVVSVAAAFQAVPSIAVVAIAFLALGIGTKPAVAALVVYSLAPIVFNAVSGIAAVDRGVVAAAVGIGYRQSQVLLRIKLPLAFRVIMGGVRSAATINIGTATVAAVIGGGGLGDLIFSGLKLRNDEAVLAGAMISALLAMIIDALLAVFEKAASPRGLSIKR